jgi:hypothetical protein
MLVIADLYNSACGLPPTPIEIVAEASMIDTLSCSFARAAVTSPWLATFESVEMAFELRETLFATIISGYDTTKLLMNNHTFLWHDYETFGAVPRRDRPAQFAAIRTDADLNEIGEPVMLYCKPADDYLPDPQSCLITGITPQQALREGVPEHQFAATIQALFAEPGTVGVGYNTIRFDDEFTRFLFWRNLIDP